MLLHDFANGIRPQTLGGQASSQLALLDRLSENVRIGVERGGMAIKIRSINIHLYWC